MDFNRGMSNAKSSSDDEAESSSTKRGSSMGFIGVVRKLWFVVVIIVVVVVGVVVWSMQQASVDATWKKASDLHGRADYAAAAKLIGEMPVPTDEKRLFVYAETMMATGQYDKALPAYKSMYDNNKDPDTKNKIGNVYSQQKKYDEAAKVYRELIASNYSYIQAYTNLASVYMAQGKMQDALEVYRLGIKSNPNSVVLYEALIGILHVEKGKKSNLYNATEYKEAIATLKKLNPSDLIFDSIKN